MVGCQNPAIEEHSKRPMILVAWSQNPAIEEHSKRPMILAACYEEPPVEGHPEGNWALIDLHGTNHGDDRVVLECPYCLRRYIRNATELVEVWKAQGSPIDLWL